MEYKINDIFYADEDYYNKVKFCNENSYKIVEIEADNNGRRFQIQKNPELSEEILLQQEINLLKGYLLQTDYQAIKYGEGLISDDDYSTIKAQREEWRNKINELQQKLS